MTITPELMQAWEQGFAVCENRLREIPTPTDEVSGRFYHIMSVLTDAARCNYEDLRKAHHHDNQIMMAWACRNLLEITVLSKYVLLSEENASDFAADRLIDGVEIGTTLKKLQDLINQESAAEGGTIAGQRMQQPPIGADQIIDEYTKLLNMEQVSRQRPMKMIEVARNVGLGDEYEGMNKLCSKLVHPTAWSLFTADVGSERFPEVSEIFLLYGAKYRAIVFAEFLPHIRRWGLRRKPPKTN
jgi:hypothetical protein